LHVFIDESGSFTGYQDQSLSVVGALAIPDGKLEFIKRKYAKMRDRLSPKNEEVKGRFLNERQVHEVVNMLAHNDVLFELTTIDLGFHAESDIAAYKQKHAEGMLARVDRFREPDRTLVERACHQISATPVPLYLQAIITFEVLHSIINHVPLYFAQRQPQELATFTWIVDGKEPKKITNWEMWWSWYARGALSNMSRRRPAPRLEGADYSFYERFTGKIDGGPEEGTDTSLLLADLRFSSAVEPGLELVDIVVNATRRALVGALGEADWRGIPRLMIHRKEPYIKFISLREGADIIRHPPYGQIVRQFFSSGGRLMLAPRFARAAVAETRRHPT
jgi:hypothetical protein